MDVDLVAPNPLDVKRDLMVKYRRDGSYTVHTNRNCARLNYYPAHDSISGSGFAAEDLCKRSSCAGYYRSLLLARAN